MDSTAPRSVSRPSGRVNRPSQSQPAYRRPAWAKNERSYQRYIENPPIRNNNPVDYGHDNFSYYPPFLSESLLPHELMPRLPRLLRNEAKLFVLAFAAVYTALERIEAMGKEALNRGDPKTTHKHLLSHRASDNTPASGGAETPPSYNTATIQEPVKPLPHNGSIRRPRVQMVPQLPINMFGMESPPFTPVDDTVANTPVNDGLSGIEPADFDRINAMLSKTAHDTGSSAMPFKNEVAYQIYVDQYNAEIADIKCNAFMRLEGFNGTMTREFYDLSHDGGVAEDQKAALQEFKAWQADAKHKMAGIKAKVDALEEMKMESALPPTELGEMIKLARTPI